MPINLTNPVVGAAQTDFTSPTYTMTADLAPTREGSQYVVSAVGGTQVGVEVHSVSSPFSVNFVRPATFKSLPPAWQSGETLPRNVYKVISRKGVVVAAGAAPVPMIIETVIKVPAGAETNDIASVKACLALHNGAAFDASNDLDGLIANGY